VRRVGSDLIFAGGWLRRWKASVDLLGAERKGESGRWYSGSRFSG
jgi:hypothetical protein